MGFRVCWGRAQCQVPCSHVLPHSHACAVPRVPMFYRKKWRLIGMHREDGCWMTPSQIPLPWGFPNLRIYWDINFEIIYSLFHTMYSDDILPYTFPTLPTQCPQLNIFLKNNNPSTLLFTFLLLSETASPSSLSVFPQSPDGTVAWEHASSQLIDDHWFLHLHILFSSLPSSL